MKHTESITYHKDNIQDIMVIKGWMRNTRVTHDYNTTVLDEKKGMHRADFIMDETQARLEYIVSGIRRKLDSLGYF